MTTKKLTFEELSDFFDKIPQPSQTLGIFKVIINNWNKKYEFHNLKISASNNPDYFGFSLNHYGWLGLPMPKYKKSKFHDSEDVCISIDKSDFVNSHYFPDSQQVTIRTKTSLLKIFWEQP